MSSVRLTESFGVIQARRPGTHPSIPGALVASAMHTRDGDRGCWFVSHGQARHLIYVTDKDAAREWVQVVAEALS